MRRIALLIGVSEYKSDSLKNLPGVLEDIKGMERVLSHPPTGIFDRVKLLEDHDRQKMEEEIEELFSNCQDDDLVLLFFSGHGIKTDNRLYFTATNTSKRSNGTLIENTAVAASTVNLHMHKCRAQQKILILNCCYSGAFINQPMNNGSSVDIKVELSGHLNDKGWVILTSSTAVEYTFERAYTQHLIKGIETGEADIGKDDMISVDELHEYAVRKVQQSKPDMHPKIYTSGNILKIPIAKSPASQEEKYRKEVKSFARGTGGNINKNYQKILDLKARKLGLEQNIAQKIQAEVLEPYQQYAQDFTEIIDQKHSPNREDRAFLKNWQAELGLEAQDARAIENRIKRSRSRSWVDWFLNHKKDAVFLVFLLLASFGLYTYYKFTKLTSFPTPLTDFEIEQLQRYVSAGERNLTPVTDEGNGKSNRKIFRVAKDRGIAEISAGNYQDAIKALDLTRQESAPEFYKNAPETLVYLNNAYIGNKQAYTIAVAAPFGESNTYGLGVLRGAALAQQEINNEGGIRDGNGNRIPLKFVLVNDKNEPNPKLAHYISSTNKDLKIVGLIGHQTSDLTLKLGKIYHDAGLPVISPSSTSKELFGTFGSVRLMAPSTRQLAERLALEIKKKEPNKAIVFYDTQEEYSRSFGSESCSALQTICKLWDFEEKPELDATHIKELIGDGSTALVIAFNPNKSDENTSRASRIIKAVSEINANSQSKVELFAGNALTVEGLLDRAENEQVSIVRVSPWERDLSRDLAVSLNVRQRNALFLTNNEKVLGTSDVNWYTLMAYNATKALAEALKASKSSPPNNAEELKAIRKKINQQLGKENFSVTGALGKIYFAREGYVKQGNFVCLSRVGANAGILNCQPSDKYRIK